MRRTRWAVQAVLGVALAVPLLRALPAGAQTQAQCIYTEVAAAFAEDDESVLVFGMPGPPGGVGRYELEDGALEPAAEPLGDRFGGAVVRLEDDLYLLVGAPGAAGEPNELSLFDADDLEAERIGALAVPRREFTATLVDEQVLIAGGQGTDGRGLATAEWVDFDDEVVRAAPDLSEARYDHAAALLPDGQLLVLGGRRSFSEPLASAERFDPEAGTWRAAGELSAARSRPTASPLGNGRLLVVGGQGRDGRRQAAVDMYDPIGNIWGVLPPLPEARFGHRTATLPDGRLLLLGGESVPADRVALLFDPQALDWIVGPQPEQHFNAGVPVVMDDGAVVLVGGTCQASGEPLVFQRYAIQPSE